MKKNKDIQITDRQGNLKTNRLTIERKDTADMKSYGQFMNLGFYIATPLVAGIFIGLFLDNWLHTKPIFILTLIILGSIASFYNLIKLTKENASR
jgi:ATP synthase protein I